MAGIIAMSFRTVRPEVPADEETGWLRGRQTIRSSAALQRSCNCITRLFTR